ncbi:hypothetical protein EI94DRAFT_1740447, partial [Lactarius quietus]
VDAWVWTILLYLLRYAKGSATSGTFPYACLTSQKKHEGIRWHDVSAQWTRLTSASVKTGDVYEEKTLVEVVHSTTCYIRR